MKIIIGFMLIAVTAHNAFALSCAPFTEDLSHETIQQLLDSAGNIKQEIQETLASPGPGRLDIIVHDSVNFRGYMRRLRDLINNRPHYESMLAGLIASHNYTAVQQEQFKSTLIMTSDQEILYELFLDWGFKRFRINFYDAGSPLGNGMGGWGCDDIF